MMVMWNSHHMEFSLEPLIKVLLQTEVHLNPFYILTAILMIEQNRTTEQNLL